MFCALPNLAAAVAGREADIAAAVDLPEHVIGWLIDGTARATPELQQRLAALLDVDATELFEPSPTLQRLVGDVRADPDGEQARRVRSSCRV